MYATDAEDIPVARNFTYRAITIYTGIELVNEEISGNQGSGAAGVLACLANATDHQRERPFAFAITILLVHKIREFHTKSSKSKLHLIYCNWRDFSAALKRDASVTGKMSCKLGRYCSSSRPTTAENVPFV